MHYKYLELGTLLTLDSIILCLVAIYFLPNIFCAQKLFIGISILFSYYTVLIIEQQSVIQFIHGGIYIISINIAGLIHGHSFDKQRRDNFEHHQFLKAMANTDQLTGVGNRHKFDEQFSELLEQAKKENKGIAIAIADIDFFKQYNDHYGHLAGDECLIQVAQALLTMKRHPLDSCIRFGGEEFILIKYDINSDACLAWGEKIKNTIYELNIPHANSSIDNRITISAGVIHWHPTSAFTRTQLMKLADDALYKAKASGRNKVDVHFSQVD
jgi:diguanylate cyclase (GGDEF)-like protein